MAKTRNSLAFTLALVSGILLIIGGTNSVAVWEKIKEFAAENTSGDVKTIVGYILFILIFIAVLGGIAVIIGGLLILKDKVLPGKIFIAIGAGMGLLGLIISLLIAFTQGTDEVYVWGLVSVTGIGILLSIGARMAAK